MVITLGERKVKVGTGVLRVDRVRGGKIQRRKLKSTRKGYKIVGTRSVRMKPGEKRKRKLAARKSARKRAAKLSRILKKRKISLRRGHRQGFY